MEVTMGGIGTWRKSTLKDTSLCQGGVRAASSVGSGLVELYKKRRW
jgi:hypothetical protein